MKDNTPKGCIGILAGWFIMSLVIVVMAIGMVISICIEATIEAAITLIVIGCAFPAIAGVCYVVSKRLRK